MSRYFTKAFEIDDPLLRDRLNDLEKETNHQNIDNKLISEIAVKIRSKVAQLGLDTSDYNEHELYNSLLNKLKKDDKRLDFTLRYIAAKKVNSEARKIAGLVKTLNFSVNKYQNFAIKNSTIKNIIKKNPPKKLLKELDYRSVDSLLKRINPSLILTAINFLESEAYINKLYKNYTKFKSSDIESRQISVFSAPNAKWQKLFNRIQAVSGLYFISAYELSSLVILDGCTSLKEGENSLILLLALMELNNIRSVSAYLKLTLVDKNFGNLLYNLSIKEPILNLNLLGEDVSFLEGHNLLAKSKYKISLPQLDNQDHELIDVVDFVTSLYRDFGFWRDCEYLGFLEGQYITSLNPIDVASNLVNKLELPSSINYFYKKHLKRELIRRYIDPEIIHQSISNLVDTKNSLVKTSTSNI